jgi:hypothetical protein
LLIDTIHETFHGAQKTPDFTHMRIAGAIAGVEGLNINNLVNWYAKNAPKVKDPTGGLLNSFIGQYCQSGGSPNRAGWLERFK